MNGKLILLTGATGGIGKALAEKLAIEGATLWLVARNQEKLIELETNLSGTHHAIVADLNTTAGRLHVLSRIKSHGKPLDILINAAGISKFELLEDSPDANIELTIQSNLTSPILLTQLLLSQMNPRGARIVNIGSTFGNIGFPGYSAYCASKFGLRGFSQALSRELADSSIKVQYVAPRATKTTMNAEHVNKMNKALGNSVDSPSFVATQIYSAMLSKERSVSIGFQEKIFVFLNNIASPVVDLAINYKLSLIKQFAKGI